MSITCVVFLVVLPMYLIYTCNTCMPVIHIFYTCNAGVYIYITHVKHICNTSKTQCITCVVWHTWSGICNVYVWILESFWTMSPTSIRIYDHCDVIKRCVLLIMLILGPVHHKAATHTMYMWRGKAMLIKNVSHMVLCRSQMLADHYEN